MVSVIIVNWNSKDYLRQCLTSLYAKCQRVEVEIVVVDGGSFDGCGEMLSSEFPPVRFVQSLDNIGFARANNLGVSHASGEYFLFLNPDTQFLEDSIQVLHDRLVSMPTAGAVGCRLLNRDQSLQTSCVQSYPTVLNQLLDSDFLLRRFPHSSLWGVSALYSLNNAPASVEAISGACILARRESFEQAGGFTESYFMYGEDLDLCFKIRQAGREIIYTPETKLIHFGGGSSHQAASNFSTVMMRASVFHFMRLHRGVWSALAYRVTMVAGALTRVILIGPMLLFGNRVVRHGSGSWRKWAAILGWSLGFGPAVPQRPLLVSAKNLSKPVTG